MKVSCLFALSLALFLAVTAMAEQPVAYPQTPYDHYLAVQHGHAPPHGAVSFEPPLAAGYPQTANQPPSVLAGQPLAPPVPQVLANNSFYNANGNVATSSAGSNTYGDWHVGGCDAAASGGNGGCADGTCQSCYGSSSGWYGSVAGLIMTRDLPDRLILTSEDGFPDARILSNRDADVDWEGGFEITFGRCLSDCVRWEAAYWTLSQFSGGRTVLSPVPTLITPIDLTSVSSGPDLASDFFDFSSGHTVLRRDDLHNLEMNLYYRPNGQACGGGNVSGSCSPWDIELLAGARYFQFEEFLRFGGVEGGASFGDLGGLRELYIESDVENHLIGAQIGALIDYHVAQNWTLYARPKVGLYGNHTRLHFDVRRGDNSAVASNLITGDTFPVRASKNDVSMLAEIDLGVRWDFARNWSGFAAYRAVAVTGMALSDDQIPAALADLDGIRDIDSSGSLILHGLVLGVQFQY